MWPVRHPAKAAALNSKVKHKQSGSSEWCSHQVMQSGRAGVRQQEKSDKCPKPLFRQHGLQNIFSAIVPEMYFKEDFIFISQPQASVWREMYHDTNLPLVTGHPSCLNLRLMSLALRLFCTEGGLCSFHWKEEWKILKTFSLLLYKAANQ